MNNQDCLFCKIVSGTIKSDFVMDHEAFIVINDINPKAPIHCLIIPKIHVENVLLIPSDFFHIVSQTLKAPALLAQKLGVDACNIISNNGEKAGQSVLHLHWHFLAGKNIYQKGDFTL